MNVLVLGGGGPFGAALLPQLAAQGLSSRAVGRADGVDLADAVPLARALDEVLVGVDVVVHAASDPRRPKRVDVAGTSALLEAVKRHRSVRHLVYLSIVGVDRTPFPYYRAKRAAEQLIERSGVPFTIVRSTQWFGFVAQVAGAVGRFGVAPRDWTVAPCDVSEAATLVARRVMAPPLNRTVEIGGPQRLLLSTAARDVSGHPVLHLGVPGALSKAVRSGSLLPGPGAETGSLTWEGWLRGRRTPGGG